MKDKKLKISKKLKIKAVLSIKVGSTSMQSSQGCC